MRLLKLAVASLLLSVGFATFTMTMQPVYAAYDPLAPACNTPESKDSPNCSTTNKTDNPLVGANGLLTKITRIIAIVAGFAGVLLVILGGFNYITAAGDPQKAKKARDTIVGALIGLVIVALAQFIITFVLKKL